MNATERLHDSQAKLATAEKDLADFQAIMGSLAATNFLPDLATRLAELQAAVTVAQAAVATAKALAPDPRIAVAQSKLARAQRDAAHWRAEVEKWAIIQQEHESPFVEARAKVEEAVRFQMWHDSIVLNRQLELAELTGKPAQAA